MTRETLRSGVTTRARVIVDNDFSGDPDDLFQLVHHLLSPSVEIVLIVGSHLPVGDHFDPSDHQADNAAAIAGDLAARLGRHNVPVVAGSNEALAAAETHRASAAVTAIIAEALRDDPRPLYYCAGAGLTDLASALAVEPGIAERITLVWIGGEDHPGLTGTGQRHTAMEFNLSIDVRAAQIVFATPELRVWQVPRGTYLQAIVGYAELDQRVGAHGEVGLLLVERLRAFVGLINPHLPMGETYVLGDQPLVLLTALQNAFDSETSSSAYTTIPRPQIGANGRYRAEDTSGSLRVYTALDQRLMFDDLFAKIEQFR